MMHRLRLTVVPLVLGVVALLAMLALVDDRNTRTWAVVMGLTTVAAVSYGAYQEHVASRAVAIARRRLGGTPFDDVRREMDRARRHERSVAVVRIVVPSSASPQAVAKLIDAIHPSGAGRSGPRSADRFWRSGDSIYLLLPETAGAGARSVVRRTIAASTDFADCEWTVAAFPEDALTVGALFAALGASPPRAEDLPLPAREGLGALDPHVALGSGVGAGPPEDG